MHMCPEDKTSIVGNCAMLAFLFVALCFMVVAAVVLIRAGNQDQELLAFGGMGVIVIILSVNQISIIRKKLAIRKEEEKDEF